MFASTVQQKSVVKISLTTFVDFVLASGTPRLTCLKEAKLRYEKSYQPQTDFYKQLREFIVQMHEQQLPPSALTNFVATNTNVKKDKSYENCLAGYLKWMGKKKFEWIDCESVKWQLGNLIVSVNPELGLSIDGVDHIIKLYFKPDSPSKLRLATMLHLIKTTLPKAQSTAIPAVLDVQRGKLFVPTVEISGLSALLAGEAAAFLAMWYAL